MHRILYVQVLAAIALGISMRMRMTVMSRRIVLLFVFGITVSLLAQEPALPDDLVTALRAGKLVILLRHGSTVSDQTDRVPFDFDDITAQRNLNDKGKALARSFGDALREIGVPVGQVFTSKFNRAYETATLAGLTNIERTDDLTLAYGPNGLVVSPEENDRRAETFRKRLMTAPAPGTDTILITHQPNIVDALGKDWSDVKEGEALIFRPEQDAFRLVARIPIERWPQLASGK
jgi:phosphohistidine phosphatase SixA